MSDLGKARVWNDWTKEHVEEFRGDTVRIPSKKYVVMDWQDAVQFRGQFTPIVRDGLGTDLKPKMIRLERIDAAQAASDKFVCQMDGAEFQTQAQLDAHIAANYKEAMLDEEARKKFSN
jgi:hypothetical protein